MMNEEDDPIELDDVESSFVMDDDPIEEEDDFPSTLLLRPRARLPVPVPRLSLPLLPMAPPPPLPEPEVKRAVEESLSMIGADVPMMREYHAVRKLKAFVANKPVVFSVDDLVADGNCGYAVYADVLNARHGSKMHSAESIRATVHCVFAKLRERMILRSQRDTPAHGLFTALPVDFFNDAAQHPPYEMPDQLTDIEMTIIDLVYRLRTFVYKTRRPGQLQHQSDNAARALSYSLPRLTRDELTSNQLSLITLFLYDVFSSDDGVDGIGTVYTKCIQLHQYPAGADAENTLEIMTETFPASVPLFFSEPVHNQWVYENRRHCAFVWSVVLSSPVCIHGNYEENHFVMLRPHWDLDLPLIGDSSSSVSTSANSLTSSHAVAAKVIVQIDHRDSYRIHGCTRFKIISRSLNQQQQSLASMIREAQQVFRAGIERRWLVMWIAGSPQSASVLRLFDPPRAVWLNKFTAIDDLSEIERKHGLDRRSAFVYDNAIKDVFVGCAIKPHKHWYHPIPVGHPFFFFSGTREFYMLEKATKCYGVYVNNRQLLRFHSASEEEHTSIEQTLAAFMEVPSNNIERFRNAFVAITKSQSNSSMSHESIPIKDAQFALSYGRIIQLVDCDADHTRLRKYCATKAWTLRDVHEAFEFCSTAFHAERAQRMLTQPVPFSAKTPTALLLGVMPRMRPFIDNLNDLAALIEPLTTKTNQLFHVSAKTLFAYRIRIRNTLLRHGMAALLNTAGLYNAEDPDMNSVSAFHVNQAQFLETWRNPESMQTLFPLIVNLFNLLLLSGNSDEAAHVLAALMHGSVIASNRAVASLLQVPTPMEDVDVSS